MEPRRFACIFAAAWFIAADSSASTVAPFAFACNAQCSSPVAHRVYAITPHNIDINGDRFIDLKPVCALKRVASILAACNVFLVWLRAVAYLNILPSCAILTTESASSSWIASTRELSAF